MSAGGFACASFRNVRIVASAKNLKLCIHRIKALDLEKDPPPIKPRADINLKRDHHKRRERLAPRTPPVHRPPCEHKRGLAQPVMQDLMEQVNENRIRPNHDK